MCEFNFRKSLLEKENINKLISIIILIITNFKKLNKNIKYFVSLKIFLDLKILSLILSLQL